MKPESYAMVKQYQNLFQPIIERGGYVADKTMKRYVFDPVNFIIPGLIRVVDGDIEGVPAGDYPVDSIGSLAFCGHDTANRNSLEYNIATLSISENMQNLGWTSVGGMAELQSLLLPSTLEVGNIENNFLQLGTLIHEPNTAPDGPVNTGLGTQPNPVIPPPTSPTQSKLLSLYYPLTMPYYLKSLRKKIRETYN